MARVSVNDTTLTSIANAIREKNGETTKYKPAEMPGAILALGSGESVNQGSSVEAAILSRTIEGTYRNEELTKLGGHALGDCQKLEKVDLPNVERIYRHALGWTHSLVEVNMPKLWNIQPEAFVSCGKSEGYISNDLSTRYGVLELNFPAVTGLSDKEFIDCNARKITLEGLRRIEGNSVFEDCMDLEELNIPNVISIEGDNHFLHTFKLKMLYLPNIESIGYNAFYQDASTVYGFTDIYLGCAEGEIPGAPWGAGENVTIHYNCVEE